MAAVLSAFIGSFVPFYDLELDSWILEAVMDFLQSLTAKAAMPAKEKKSITAKTAEGAKGTTIESTPRAEREATTSLGVVLADSG